MAKTDTIPTQANIKAIADGLSSQAKSMNKIVNSLVGFANSLGVMNSIKTDTKTAIGIFNDVFNCFIYTTNAITRITPAHLKNLEIGSKNLIDAIDILKTDIVFGFIVRFNETLDSFQEFVAGQGQKIVNVFKSNQLETKKDKNSIINTPTVKGDVSFIDVINLVLNISKQMADIKDNALGLVGSIKFKIKFSQMLKNMKFVWDRTKATFLYILSDTGQVTKISSSISILFKSLKGLPEVFGSVVQSLVQIGKNPVKTRLGIALLVGRKGHGGNGTIVGAISIFIRRLSLAIGLGGGGAKVAKNAIVANLFVGKLLDITRNFALMGLLATPALAGILLVTPVVLIMCWMMKKMSRISKRALIASKTIMMISAAITLLSLSVTLIALTGVLIVKAWPIILVTLTFILGLITIIGLLGSFVLKRLVGRGAKTLLEISLTVVLLSLTVILIAQLGDFVNTNWENFGMVAAMMGILLGVFLVIGLFSKFINKAANSLVKIALCVAILAIVAIVLVEVSDMISGDWEGILMIGTVMLGLALTMVLIGNAAKKVKILKFIILMLGVILMSYIIQELDLVSQNSNLAQLTGVVLLMESILIVLAGIMVALGTLPKKLVKQGEIALGVIAACSLALAATVITLAEAINKAGDMNKIWEGAGIMGAIVGVLTALVIGLGALTLTGIGAIGLAAGVGVLGSITLIAMGLSKCIKEIAVTAAIMKAHNLDRKVLENTMKMPIEVIKDIISTTLKDVKVTTVMAAMLKFKPLASISEGIGTMANVLRDIALLNIPTKLDDKGNPIEWRQMNATDFENAGLNAAVCASILTKIFTGGGEVEVGDGNGGKKTIFVAGVNMDEIENISFRSMLKFKCITNLSTGIGNLAQVIKDIASFSIPSGFNEDGTPKGYRAIDPTTDLAAVGENVALMVGTIVQVFGKPEVKEAIKGIDTGFLGFGGDTKAIEAVFNAVGHLSGVTTLLSCIARGKMPYEQYTETDKNGNTVTKWRYTPISQLTNGSVDTNIKNMITTVIKGFTLNKEQEKQLDLAEDNIDDINKVVETGSKCITTLANAYTNSLSKIDANAMNSTLSSILAVDGPMKRTIDIFDSYSGSNASANTFDKQTKSAINFLKQVNDTDLSKLKQTTSMFEEIRKFSQSIRGDFEELAECINEEIIEAIEKLEETLTKIKDEGFNVNVSGGATQQPTVSDMKPTGDKATQATIKNLQDKIKVLENGTNAALRKLGSCIDNGRMKVNTD